MVSRVNLLFSRETVSLWMEEERLLIRVFNYSIYSVYLYLCYNNKLRSSSHYLAALDSSSLLLFWTSAKDYLKLFNKLRILCTFSKSSLLLIWERAMTKGLKREACFDLLLFSLSNTFSNLDFTYTKETPFNMCWINLVASSTDANASVSSASLSLHL